jgi:hypothetical protein
MYTYVSLFAVWQGTVEERIVQRAQKKLFLDCMVNRGSTAQGQEIDRKLQQARDARSLAAATRVNTIDQGGEYEDDDEGETEQQQPGSSNEEGNGKVSSNTRTGGSSSGTEPLPRPAGKVDEAEEQMDATTVMSALKFGWNACFGGDGDALSISDAALDAIIDRTRTCDSAVNALISSGSGGGAVKTEGKKESLSGSGLQEGQQSSVTQFEEAAPLVDLRTFEGTKIDKAKAVSLSLVCVVVLAISLFL